MRAIISFLGHVGFYRRFIKDFSKVSKLLNDLLQKDIPFSFDDDCIESFETLKKDLIFAPIIQPLDWNLPFEIMCDASDYVVGVYRGVASQYPQMKNLGSGQEVRQMNSKVNTDKVNRIVLSRQS
jgi:hypothetical protein